MNGSLSTLLSGILSLFYQEHLADITCFRHVSAVRFSYGRKYSNGRNYSFGRFMALYSPFSRFRCFGKKSLSVAHYHFSFSESVFRKDPFSYNSSLVGSLCARSLGLGSPRGTSDLLREERSGELQLCQLYRVIHLL